MKGGGRGGDWKEGEIQGGDAEAPSVHRVARDRSCHAHQGRQKFSFLLYLNDIYSVVD